jgi:regulator of protease activity HflC (stomatin/prohibitin superfamily)
MALVVFGVFLLILSFVLPPLLRAQGHATGPAPVFGRVLGVLMVAGGLLYSCVVLIPAGYRGVLLRFGAVGGVLGEGIHLIVPSVNTVELLEVRTQKEEAQSSAASKDLQTVSATIALNFHVEPTAVGRLYQKVGLDYRSRVIDPAVQESLKVVTARYTAEELIRLRDKVKGEVQSDMTQRLRAYDVVVEPSGVSLTNFTFSEEFNKAIEQKQVAQQTAEKQKYVLDQAKLEAETAITKAKGAAEAARVSALALQSQGGRLVLAREWIERWDGKLPAVSGGGAGMIIDVRELMQGLGKETPPR